MSGFLLRNFVDVNGKKCMCAVNTLGLESILPFYMKTKLPMDN